MHQRGPLRPESQPAPLFPADQAMIVHALWQNDKGTVALWQMNGDHIASNTTVGSALGWNVVDTGDYDHDGNADVLFETASGVVGQWQMDGDHIVDSLNVGSHSINWHVV